MRKIFLTVAVLLFAIAAFAQEKETGKGAAPPLQTQVHKLWQAYKTKDKATLATLLDDDFRMFEEGLSTFGDKKSEVNSVDEFELSSYALSDFRVKPLGPDTALER